MIPKKPAPDLDPGWVPVFGKACPGRDPGIMLKQRSKATCRFSLKSFRFSALLEGFMATVDVPAISLLVSLRPRR
jgi:hypothetical protein